MRIQDIHEAIPSVRPEDQRRQYADVQQRKREQSERRSQNHSIYSMDSDSRWGRELDRYKGKFDRHQAEWLYEDFKLARQMVKRFPKLVKDFNLADGVIKYVFASQGAARAFKQCAELISKGGTANPDENMPDEIYSDDTTVSFFYD